MTIPSKATRSQCRGDILRSPGQRASPQGETSSGAPPVRGARMAGDRRDVDNALVGALPRRARSQWACSGNGCGRFCQKSSDFFSRSQECFEVLRTRQAAKGSRVNVPEVDARKTPVKFLRDAENLVHRPELIHFARGFQGRDQCGDAYFRKENAGDARANSPPPPAGRRHKWNLDARRPRWLRVRWPSRRCDAEYRWSDRFLRRVAAGENDEVRGVDSDGDAGPNSAARR